MASVIAHPHWTRVAVTFPAKRAFFFCPLTVERVQDQEPGLSEIGGVQQPFNERFGFVVITETK